ncbi:MAG TPA: hypothetical protein VEP73_06720 [Actinomycetota bacterium]|nr:hypothetical protein [Actinomycetota bacterium]
MSDLVSDRKANPDGQWYLDHAGPEAEDGGAYARALYGDGHRDDLHAGPGTGLGYTDSAYARALYRSAPPDPDVTDPNLTDSAYDRALYAEPARPYDQGERGADLAQPGYGTPYGDPDATGPFYGDHDVDLAYLGHADPAAAGGGYRHDDGTAYRREQEPFEDDPAQELEDELVDPGSLPVRRLRRLDSGRAATRRGTSLVNGVTMTLAAGIGVASLAAVMAALTGHMLTTRQLFFMTHAACGIVIVHAFGGGLTTLAMTKESRTKELVRKWSVAVMAVVAWITVLVGTWLGYPGYRAEPAHGAVNLNAYPRAFLLAHRDLAFWDTFAMEWKVNSGWVTPFLATAVAFVVLRHHRLLLNDPRLRRMLTNLFVIAFAAALLGSMLGAVVNVVAPNDFLHRPWHP